MMISHCTSKARTSLLATGKMILREARVTTAITNSTMSQNQQQTLRYFSSSSSRNKSSLAAVEDDIDFEETEQQTRRLGEEWKDNLGRNDGRDNEWLTGPRDEAKWYTGVKPSNCPGFENGILRSLPFPNLTAVTRKSAKEYLDNSWTLYEMLFAGLNGEDYFYRGPFHGLRHPQIFYYGHTPCLYINKLRVAGLLEKPVNAYFESIFEVGVDEMIWDEMHKNDMIWPMVSEVYEYRKQVYATLVDVINRELSDETPTRVTQDHPLWALFMGFEHERIHFETSSVLFREAPLRSVKTPKYWPPLHPSASVGRSPAKNPQEGVHFPTNPMIPALEEETTIDLGKPNEHPTYGWDNEYGERAVKVPPFSASKYMITNGEFYEFVKSGGYMEEKYWCENGSAFIKHRNLRWPFFWKPTGPAGSHEYNLRTIFSEIDMPWDWPVDVTYYEAKAFSRWKDEKSKTLTRLLTEAEHHVLRHETHNLQAARHIPEADLVMQTNSVETANFNFAFGSHNPVTALPPSPLGHHDVMGNAWEWTEDHFNPLENFRIHPVYTDFSTPCFDGKHSMIVGGSFMSTGDEASVFARFHFRPHFLQHSGFRLVTSEQAAPATHLNHDLWEQQIEQKEAEAMSSSLDNVYETDESLNMYLGLHYDYVAEEEEGDNNTVPAMISHENAPLHGLHFPQRVAQLLTRLVQQHNPSSSDLRALDLGCAVGGSSFELAKHFHHVDAIDYSHQFIDAAQRIQNEERISFRIPLEAKLSQTVLVQAPKINKFNIHFQQGDATKLENFSKEKKYDAILMSNLLCRLPDPLQCLRSLPIADKNGIVLMVSPYSWLEEFTHQSQWLGGYPDPVTNKPFWSADHIEHIMTEDLGYSLIHEEEVPCLIREHQRKYQYIVSHATAWQRQ
mmetsp:Transcript_1798/g.2737  ORF Transcript_1798/g.2737 Transcript_1798/m.2737 type:complete len:900 (-) Transcript_1798:1715-4414(-)